MRITKYIIAALVLLAVIGYNGRLFSWGLFDLFTDTDFDKTGLEKVETFDPDEDILYLPPLGDKDIFEASKDLSICRKRSVRHHLYKYLTSHRAYLIRAIEKSYIYKDIIEEVFEENSDIPEELSLLPLLESGFDPYAVSKSNAVGLWQFMRGTSTPLGLKRSRWLDERRHVRKSTEAALQHLRNLYKLFKSWDLALAAYNAGGGYVNKLQKKTGARDIWELRKSGLLREETREYVPRFIALLLIYKNQRLFGIKDEINIPESMDVEVLTVTAPVKIEHIAKLVDLPVDTIRKLNPELQGNITPPGRKRYNLLLPVDAIKKLKKNKKKLYQYKISRVRKHRIKRGESLSLIAEKYKKKQVPSSGLTV